MMLSPDKDTFFAEVHEVVACIPPGRVLTYGDIARLIGWPSHSRMVGRVLREVPQGSSLPCHRVVNSSGRTAPGWEEQRRLLSEEGILWNKSGRVDLHRCRWNIGELMEPF